MKKKLKNIQLYVVTTDPINNYDYQQMIEEICQGGADIIQYRDESSPLKSDKIKLENIKIIRAITRKYQVIFIVNNRIDLAILGQADGVHLGQEDISITEARKITNIYQNNFIIGKSTHSLEQAEKAVLEGADYLGIGPLIQTPTKPTYIPIGFELARKVQKEIKIPAVAIGGINLENIDFFIKEGIKRVAIVRAICHSENIKETTEIFKNKLINCL